MPIDREYQDQRRKTILELLASRPMGRQIENGRAREPRAPVAELLFQDLAAQPLALPDGEIRVLDVEGRQP